MKPFSSESKPLITNVQWFLTRKAEYCAGSWKRQKNMKIRQRDAAKRSKKISMLKTWNSIGVCTNFNQSSMITCNRANARFQTGKNFTILLWWSKFVAARSRLKMSPQKMTSQIRILSKHTWQPKQSHLQTLWKSHGMFLSALSTWCAFSLTLSA